MAQTPSTMIALGTVAPDFSLPDVVSGQTVSLTELRSEKATLVMFICNHCPFVKHIQRELVQLATDYLPQQVAIIAINANDAETYPQDNPEAMKATALEWQYPFPYLYDETQEVAKAYQAACTPDFFLFDGQMRCVYRGQLDDSRPNNGIPVTGQDVRRAIDAVLSDQNVPEPQKPSIGCNIKWRKTT
ncbi:thioredoxin family protein [Thioflexithrix psekupsensis]|uniref:Thioredoxin family protein n=1 Tax=Thioflexithrix psekupsensis TaxID=1570016 RepID=A0A251XAT4_9GAMM|nr:thioredoxin family protein [Thioflexithrix psekupsensis]OUD15479.1 thioredoxin family protein [Thioflexithrix psekupsensis]